MRGAVRRITASLRTHGALGLRPVTAPVMIFIPLGMLLGPAGADVISRAALGHLDVVVSVALATLGVFIGIAAGTQRGAVGRLMTASTVEATVTMLVVGGAAYVLLRSWNMPLEITYALVALTLGVCASASAAPSVEENDTHARRVAARVADLYVVFRTVGKLTGGWMASRLAPGVASSDLGAYLIPPGVIGIAFALNVLQVAPGGAMPLVFAVSAGAIVSELLAVIVTPVPHAASA